MTTQLKQQFVVALDKGDFRLAQEILFSLYNIYSVHGFDTIEEAVEFETVVKWFDSNIVEAKEGALV